jgi:hypothetical protein
MLTGAQSGNGRRTLTGTATGATTERGRNGRVVMSRGFDRYMVELDIGANLKISRLKDREFRCVIAGVWPLAGKANPRGFLVVCGQPATAQDVAHQARCTPATARKTLEKMRELELLDPPDDRGFEYCHDWHVLNPDPRPSDSREARRERKNRQRGHANVTRDKQGMSRASHDPEVEGEVEVPASTTSQQVPRKRASRRIDQTKVPDDFPAPLSSSLPAVLTRLHGIWDVRGGIEPQPRGVALAMLRNHRADHTTVARRLEHWLTAGNGQRAQCKDVTARFAKWLEDEPAAGSGQVVALSEKQQRQQRRLEAMDRVIAGGGS